MNNRFKIYRSSAGSGKTFTLTKEYLKLALASPGDTPDSGVGKHASPGDVPGFNPQYFRHILAVTFTNDAANEMKQRIVDKLAEISHANPIYANKYVDDMLRELAEEYPGLDLTREELIKRAGKVYNSLLHNYSDFSVSTIDAFNNRVVQSFTKDLDLPYNYEIELETEDLLEEATHQLLNEAGDRKDRHLSNLLLEFARKKVDDNTSWEVDQALREFGTNLFREEKQAMLGNLGNLSREDFRTIKQRLYEYKGMVEKQIHLHGLKALQLIQRYGLEASHFYQGNKGIYNYFKKHSESDFDDGLPDANSYARTTVDQDKWTAGKISNEQKAAIEGIKDDLKNYYHTLEDFKKTHRSNYLAVNQLIREYYLLAMINELEKKVRKIMTDKNQVHISMFNRKINQIVEEEPVPYLYERIGERYRHILIDEFQDTSQMQWHNLIPLIVNSLGSDHLNLIVGDAKQAIYRWRGGKSELIVSLPYVPTAAGSMLEQETYIFHEQHKVHSLQSNYRSRKQIIDFNNELFTKLCKQYCNEYPSLQEYYAEVKQLHNEREGGHVEITFIPAPIQEEYRSATFDKVHELVKDLTINQGFKYNDIAILTRTNDTAAFLAENFLAEKIQVISSESLLVSYSRKVNFLVNFIRLMAQPLNPVVKAQIVYFIYEHFNEELGIEVTGDIHSEISAVGNTDRFSEFVAFIRHKFGIGFNFEALQYLSLYEIAEELIRLFSLNHDLTEQIYLQKLLDLMLEFGLREGNNLMDFIEYWDKKKDRLSVTTPKSGNAIQIMTIHKSKGLQFPVVIVPFADWSLVPRAGTKLWLDWRGNDVVPELNAIILSSSKELLNTDFAEYYQQEQEAAFIDAINMLYVALTRPEDKLYILCQSKERKNDKEDAKLRSINELLERYAEDYASENMLHAEDEEDKADRLNCVFHHDASAPTPKPQHREEEPYMIGRFISTECRDKIRVRKNDLRHDDPHLSVSAFYTARRQGLLIHYAFEKVRFREDLPMAMRKLINEGLITEAESVELKNRMEMIMDLPAISAYYDRLPQRRVCNERELLLKANDHFSPNRILRPDRVVIDHRHVAIIDYKTGEENPQEATAQLLSYAQEFEKMGFEKIKKFVVYTETMKAVEVDS